MTHRCKVEGLVMRKRQDCQIPLAIFFMTRLGSSHMTKLALVTGATGFLGSHMVELLLDSGYEVRATDLPVTSYTDDPVRGRYASVLKKPGVEFIPSNLANPQNLPELVRGVNYVFHIAALFSYIASWGSLYQINVEGTRALVEALLQEGSLKRFVLWGAGGIFGAPPPEQLPIREETTKNPPNAYLKSKWEQEKLVHQYFEREKFPYSCIRPTGVYGPRAVYGMGQVVQMLGKKKKISLPKSFTGRMAFIHSTDVSRSALYVAEHTEALGEAYNLVDDTPYTNVEFFEFLAEILGKPFSAIPLVPVGLVKSAGYVGAVIDEFVSKKILKKKPSLEKDTIFFLGVDFWYSNEKLKKLGYQFTYPDSKKGWSQTIPWYKEVGLI